MINFIAFLAEMAEQIFGADSPIGKNLICAVFFAIPHEPMDKYIRII